MGRIGRNKECSCGSGRKYKRCCGTAAGQVSVLPDPGPVTKDMKVAAEKMLAEEGYDAEAALAIREMQLAQRARKPLSRTNAMAVALMTLGLAQEGNRDGRA